MIVPVILSGGSGTRLWPLSTPEKPKQFLPLVGEESLFHETLTRVSDPRAYLPPVVVANSGHVDLCLDEMANIDGARLILEPCARNTAVAIAMAAGLVASEHGPESLILVMPSDHCIGDEDSFHAAVQIGQLAAQAGRLVTFGVAPTGPETGYGYLETGKPLDNAPGAFEVARFIEKPDFARAETMASSGRHFWNGGIFLFRASDFLAEIGIHAPEIHDCAVRALANAERRGPCIFPAFADLEPCPNVSVDYAVMERSNIIAMAPLDANWSDVGSWDALAQMHSKSPRHPLATTVHSENCYVRSDGLKVSLLGVHDLVVVASGGHVLIMRKGQSQQIRQLVEQATAVV